MLNKKVMDKVGVVVVTFNRLELLKEVVTALRLQAFKPFSIIIVNNGSTDGTNLWLSSQSDLVVINQGNVGGAGGFYTGMKYVAENGFDYCWIMDDDVICQSDTLEKLIEAIKVKADIGFVCSKVVSIDNLPMNVPKVDERFTQNGYACYYEFIENQMIKVQVATFVSVLFPVHVIVEKGLPIKEYFIWGDDSEYTMRLSSNRDCYLACKSIVIHKRKIQGNLSLDNENNPKRMGNYFYYYRNFIRNSFVYDSFFKFLSNFCYIVIKDIKYLFTFKFRKFFIILKALILSLFFSPQIRYPNK